jgi:tetratricopeptide (TPR) repeat protein
MRFYARAVARAQQRDRAEFDKEIKSMRAVGNSDLLKPMIDQGVPAAQLVQLAEKVALARWAQANRRFGKAVELYHEAAKIEQSIPYMEPPYWYYPVNQSLGAALFQAKRYKEARDAFETALAQSPHNGWVLYGLAASERALGRTGQMRASEAALQQAWSGDPRWLRMERL